MSDDIDLESVAQVLGKVSAALRDIATHIDADRTAVRDGNGNIVAVQRQRMPRSAPQGVSDVEAAVDELVSALHTLVASLDAERELVSEGGKVVGSRRKAQVSFT